MRAQPATGKLCVRAREWASLRLDGELSEFEGALLRAHAARCADCRAFMRETEAITEHVRATPLEPLERPVLLPSRRRLLRPVPLAAAATVAALAGLVSGLSLERQAQLSPSYSAPPIIDAQQIRAVHRAQLRPVVLRLNIRPRPLEP